MVALYFGSFNPIHWGHLIIADCAQREGGFEKVIFIPSFISPFKTSTEPHRYLKLPKGTTQKLFAEQFRIRLKLLTAVLAEWPESFDVSNIEGHLPAPSYTAHTLRTLRKKNKYPGAALLFGEDNLTSLPEWKDGAWIARNFPIYSYPRGPTSEDTSQNQKPNPNPKQKPKLPFKSLYKLRKVPRLPFSSTEVRARMMAGKSIDHLVPHAAIHILRERNLLS